MIRAGHRLRANRDSDRFQLSLCVEETPMSFYASVDSFPCLVKGREPEVFCTSRIGCTYPVAKGGKDENGLSLETSVHIL